jgi:hypothetical protein
MQTNAIMRRSFAALGLAVALVALCGFDGCDVATPPQPSRFQATVVGKWSDENVQLPVTKRTLWFGKNGVVTDTWVYFGMENVTCTAWATYSVLEYGNGTFADLNYTHKVGTCDDINFKSGSFKLDVRDSDHILFGDASFARIQ